MAASQMGRTCHFNYVFIHFFDDFIVNYRFASAFIPESKADVNVVGGSTHLSDQADLPTLGIVFRVGFFDGWATVKRSVV
jgi:hypothetical protein